MHQRFTRGAKFALLAQSCALVFGFQQSPEGPIAVVPRPAARPASLSPILRVDSSLVLIPVRVTTADGASVTNLNIRGLFRTARKSAPLKTTSLLHIQREISS